MTAAAAAARDAIRRPATPQQRRRGLVELRAATDREETPDA